VPTVLPNYYTIISSQGSAWSAVFALQNDDGTPMDIAGKTFEFVARPAVTNRSTPPQVEVTSVTNTAQGEVNVNVTAATVEVVVNASANSGWTGGTYTLWMNPGLVDATALVQGPYLLQPTTVP
jgi:hypothetical protein